MKTTKNKWQKCEVGCCGNFETLKPLKIVEKNGAMYGIEYINKNGKKQVLYSHYLDIDVDSFK